MGVFRRNRDEQQRRSVRTGQGFSPLTAAASRVPVNDKGEAEAFRKRRGSNTSAWQTEAWEYFDAIGEIKYAFYLVSNVVSRVRLYAAVTDDSGENPVPVRSSEHLDADMADAADRALARLSSAYGGQPGLLRDAALNLSVAGECYLVQVPARPGQGLPETWDIRSVDELQVDQNGRYIIVPSRDASTQVGRRSKGVIELPSTAFVGRIWRAHPRYSDEPDSSMRGVLDLCADLLLLDRTARSTMRSRLNSGAMYLPDGLSTASHADPDYPFDEDGNFVDTVDPIEIEDDFETQLYEAMVTPIKDEDSASAVVPLLMRGPADLGDKIKQFKFERSFDAHLTTRGDRILDRILQGIDLPKDIIKGLANVKYSNAVQIDESLYKAHIEPMLLLISDALTQVYLRPYLRSLGYSEAEVARLVIWYDPSAVSTRNDRAADADSGYEKMAVNGDTWRRAHGFSDQDAPTPTELVLRMLTQHGSFTPELTESLLTAVSPEIMTATKAAQQNASVAPVPPEVQNVLSGQNGAPADAPDAAGIAEEGGLAAPASSAPPAGGEVAPGQDAPPVPLAEPTDNEA